MASAIIPVNPFDLIIFGVSGDLSMRKILPALYHRDQDGQLPQDCRIIGVSRKDVTNEEFRNQVAEALKTHISQELQNNDVTLRFLERVSHCKADTGSESGFNELAKMLENREQICRVFYLATPPSTFGNICKKLGQAKLITPATRAVIEKPLGTNYDTAKEIHDAINQVLSEKQVYRIDHYLGKETVQNLMALRFANVILEPVWNQTYVDHIEITVGETLGVENRANYYEGAGALRDMVQNHIMQLLCLIAMEPPSSIEADSVRGEKIKVIQALEPMDVNEINRLTVRGQYIKGNIGGETVPGYRDENGVSADSLTETFTALKVFVRSWRWAGVPFYLRSGKRLARRVSEIVVTFKSIPHSIFTSDVGNIAANKLVIRLQPDEGVNLFVVIKDPGPGGMRLRSVPLDMSFADTFGNSRHIDAYERLIMDVVRGNQTLFMHRKEVETSWKWIDPILESWQNNPDQLKFYPAGSWGPTSSIALMERDNRTWFGDY